MIWDEYYARYLAALEAAQVSHIENESSQNDYFIADFTHDYFVDQLTSEPEALPETPLTSPEDVQWFVEALKNEKSKWIAVYLLTRAPSLPEALFSVLIEATVHEGNPSLIRPFVWHVARFGHVRVAEALLEYAENGTDLEKFCVDSAFYWLVVATDLRNGQDLELLGFLEGSATNLRYSSGVRELARQWATWLKQDEVR